MNTINVRDSRNPDTGSLPWYRHYYVWFLIAFPLLAVVGGITTLFIAGKTDDGLVVDDYYKHGLEINRTFERDRAADRMALEASLQINEGAQDFRILLRGNNQFAAPDRIQVSFIHATRRGMDQSSQLVALGGSVYEGELPELPPGIWNVQIEAQDWRLLKRWENN